jgi:hypothetical protein
MNRGSLLSYGAGLPLGCGCLLRHFCKLQLECRQVLLDISYVFPGFRDCSVSHCNSPMTGVGRLMDFSHCLSRQFGRLSIYCSRPWAATAAWRAPACRAAVVAHWIAAFAARAAAAPL